MAGDGNTHTQTPHHTTPHPPHHTTHTHTHTHTHGLASTSKSCKVVSDRRRKKKLDNYVHDTSHRARQEVKSQRSYTPLNTSFTEKNQTSEYVIT